MTLGVIAGRGAFPAHAIRNAKAAGRRVAVSLIREARAAVPRGIADAVETHSIGRAGDTLEFFRRENVSEVLVIGKVDKSLNFADLDFDEVALAMLSRLAGRADMQIARVVIDEMEQRGFRVCAQTEWLDDLLVGEGNLAGEPTDVELADVEKGLRLARAVAGFDIGQTVVLRAGAVIAVEAFEHTDATIRRAGRLAGPGAVIVKVARPNQDFRFDVPAIGPATLRAMCAAGARVLAVEAGRTLMMHRDRFLADARMLGLCVVGVRAPDILGVGDANRIA
ncbi:MAG: UDP-2,3-diacylglucosamine diphosphatase LpxI [Deltaproteobacteria bacterium]|nr:UDP-2,3-diacylglucosamine diphosphatase LpxI [Deltaproteobacteria bacterium]